MRSASRRWAPWVVLLASWIAAGTAAGQVADRVERLHLDEVVPAADGSGDVELYVRAETRYGEPVDALTAQDVVIRDNGELVSSGVTLARLHDAGRGATIVLALDKSRTMKGEPFQRALDAALSYIERMGPHDRISVVTFSDRVDVVVTFKDSKSRARELVRDLEIDRQALTTVLFDGAFKAVDMIRRGRDLPHRSFVVVFSDGKDDGSRATLEEVVDLAVQPGAARVPVFTIGFDRFGGGSLKSLLKLSRGTAAEAFFAQSADLVASYFDEIWRQMLHSYVIRYPADLDGGHHSIDVSIGGQSDTQSVSYPDVDSGPWLWVVAAVLGGVTLVSFFFRRPTGSGRLIFLEGPRKGESVVLGKPQLSIGALPDNDIVVPSPAVSRYHAQLQCRGRHVEIKDVGSSNGTFVNGTNVRSCPLEPGDTVRIGDIDLVYER